MNFRSNDPGAVQFGNFINYYSFNSASERIKLLPTDIWKTTSAGHSEDAHADTSPYLVLDVGCNSGVFTKLLWKFLSAHVERPVYILGVDIDCTLIERAQKDDYNETCISFAAVDVMKDVEFVKVLQYLEKHQRTKFDAVCCFSTTMWIHLNHHDSGLQYFLRSLAQYAKLFIVEPQPWKCYQTAERRLKKSGETFPLFLQLKWRMQVEQEIQIFMENELGRIKIYECYPTKWKRRICFYR